MERKKFLVVSEFAELLDLAMHLKDEGCEVLMHIPEHDYKKIGDGIIDKIDEWWRYLGKDYIWVFDGNSYGDLQDWMREKGEAVVNGCKKGDELENDRQLGQKWFKKAGFHQVPSKNFKSFDEALAFIKDKDGKYILKQNGSAPKGLSHKGVFNTKEDMIWHLEQLKKKWNVAEYGEVDFDLMEVVEGLEVAASAFFNGSEFLKNKSGKVVGFLNFEEKKEVDGNLGETTGEMGTTFIGVDETNKLFSDILLKPEIIRILKEIKFKGVFDINCIKTDKGIVALEPTCRFGIPATSYEFIEGLITPTNELLEVMAKEQNKPIEIKTGVGMVMVIAAKPYPVEGHLSKEHTSLGEKLWILQDGEPINDFTDEQKKHIHLQNFEKKDGNYLVATSNGYLLTITETGSSISDVRDNLIKYIKDNIYISGMKYRSDIGKRVENYAGVKDKQAKELDNIKLALKKAIYE